MAKSLEQPEIKEWLGSTKDMLMAEKSGKDKDEEGKKLNDILENFDKMLPKIADTRAVVDCLWKCYQVSLPSYLRIGTLIHTDSDNFQNVRNFRICAEQIKNPKLACFFPFFFSFYLINAIFRIILDQCEFQEYWINAAA